MCLQLGGSERGEVGDTGDASGDNGRQELCARRQTEQVIRGGRVQQKLPQLRRHLLLLGWLQRLKQLQHAGTRSEVRHARGNRGGPCTTAVSAAPLVLRRGRW